MLSIVILLIPFSSSATLSKFFNIFLSLVLDLLSDILLNILDILLPVNSLANPPINPIASPKRLETSPIPENIDLAKLP